MAEVVRMPKLSDTMEEGVVAEWHKSVGDQVESGDLLAEIETDKATMEFESFQEGTLLHIGVEKGDSAPVDSILAILGEEGEDVSDILEEEKKKQADSGSDSDVKEDKESEKEEPKEETKKAEPKPTAQKEEPAKRETPRTSSGRIKASPLAKKLAEDKGIDLENVEGSGDGGRIVKRDIDNYKPSATAQPAAIGQESYSEQNVSQMRKTIAKRLSESKFSAPHFYLTVEVDMDNVMEARKAVNAQTEIKVSFNDFVIKAASIALTKHPYVNASWRGDKIRFNEHVHMGVAVAVEEGLLVPVVRHANGKTLSQISSEVKEYAQKAKDKKLQPEDWEGNTFTISNLGMFGIEEFTAIINPPDSCILAVGGIVEKPVVKDGQVVPGNRMKVTLSCDHRVVDGVKGAEFLNTFKSMLENPVMMLA
jgi:pyruvate dehydrogenase E2 component (dihydrolipoamide acetyltransferase)